MVGLSPLRTFPTSGGRRYFVRDDTAGHKAAAGGGPQVGRGNGAVGLVRACWCTQGRWMRVLAQLDIRGVLGSSVRASVSWEVPAPHWFVRARGCPADLVAGRK